MPVPPLKPWQIIAVPPPTLPSGTGPVAAVSSAWWRCSGFTWNPLMSLRVPSHVSPTTGRLQKAPTSERARMSAATMASRTTPTLWVLVMAIGVVS